MFLKFDLKARFWQLKIHLEDKYKTAFCIPNHHYQWTVMPFGLKNSPSQFQKTMVTLFQPLLANALIYVDNILLFSKEADSHEKLLTQFYNLVKSQGVMLSEEKVVIGQSSIEFWEWLSQMESILYSHILLPLSKSFQTSFLVLNRHNNSLELLIICLM